MTKQITSALFVCMTALTANHSAFANIFDLLENLTQEPKLESNIFIAVGYNDRVDRRDDRSQRVEDKQDFREERRDCVGEGPGWR